MKIAHCIKELHRFIEEDGDINVESVTIDEEEMHVKINGKWYIFNEYNK